MITPRQLRRCCTLDGVASWDNLFLAAAKARRGKSRRPDVEAWWLRRETELAALREELLQGSYNPGPYRFFIVHELKRRQRKTARVLRGASATNNNPDKPLSSNCSRLWLRRALAALIFAFILAQCGCSTQSNLDLIFRGIAQANPGKVEYHQPEVTTYRGREGVVLKYDSFSVRAPAQGRWRFLKDADDCVVFSSATIGIKPHLTLIAVRGDVSSLPLGENYNERIGITDARQLVNIEEALLKKIQSEPVDAFSSVGNERTGLGSLRHDGSIKRGQEEHRTQMRYRLREKDIQSDTRFSRTGIRFKAVFEAIGEGTMQHPVPVTIDEGFFFIPDGYPKKFVRVEALKWQIEGSKDHHLDQAAEEFLDGFTFFHQI